MSCCAVWQYTGYAHDNPGKPFEKIVYTWLGTDTGHMNYVKHDGTPAPFHADAGFLLDPLSAIWLLFVTGVGTLIHIYSTGYMAHEGGYYRFFGYLNLFMFSMLTLILANNYVLMFVGWEGVGLCSYLLIGFYFHRHSASDRRQQGIHRQPHRRRRIPAGHVHHRLVLRLGALHRSHPHRAQRTFRHRRSHHHRRDACSCSSAPAASRRSFRSTSGCPTPWKAPPRSPP